MSNINFNINQHNYGKIEKFINKFQHITTETALITAVYGVPVPIIEKFIVPLFIVENSHYYYIFSVYSVLYVS